MLCSDLILVYKDKPENGKLFIAYDKDIIISANYFGIEIKSLKQLFIEKSKFQTFKLQDELSYVRKNKLKDFLHMLLNKQIKLKFQERRNFVKYINKLYKELCDVELLGHPSLPANAIHIINSNVLIKE